MADWARVATAVERQRAVRFSSREAAADASGVAVTVWQQLERAKKDSYRQSTLARVEHALDWELGTIEDIANGGPVPPLQPSSAAIRGGVAPRVATR